MLSQDFCIQKTGLLNAKDLSFSSDTALSLNGPAVIKKRIGSHKKQVGIYFKKGRQLFEKSLTVSG